MLYLGCQTLFQVINRLNESGGTAGTEAWGGWRLCTSVEEKQACRGLQAQDLCVLWALTFLFSKVSGRSQTSPTFPSRCAHHQQVHIVTSLALPPAFAISNVSPVFSSVQLWRPLLRSLPLPFRCSAQPVLKITHILGLLQMGKAPPPRG